MQTLRSLRAPIAGLAATLMAVGTVAALGAAPASAAATKPRVNLNVLVAPIPAGRGGL